MMKILLKILVAPFALALSLLTALLVFLFDICAFLLTIASVILAVLGTGNLISTPTGVYPDKEVSMAVSKSQKIQAEIDKVKAKISEQQARLKELEKNKQEAENSEIVDIVRGMSISLEELPLVLQRLRDDTSGQSVQKSEDGGKEEN